MGTTDYQTIWSFICWSDDDEVGGKDPGLFWELDWGGTTLLGLAEAEPNKRNEKLIHRKYQQYSNYEWYS